MVLTQAPTPAQHTEHDRRVGPDQCGYRVYKHKLKKLVCTNSFPRAARLTRANEGDVLYQHDGQRWRIWTSAGLF